MSKKIIFFVLSFVFSNFLFSLGEEYDEKKFPYVSPFTFMELADFIYQPDVKFNANSVFEGAVVYAPSLHLSTFFSRVHKKIKHRYILITHGSDHASPGRFVSFLKDPKIIAWLGRNPSLKSHKKFHPIPIGLNARIEQAAERVMPLYDQLNEFDVPKEHLLYLNINVGTNEKERGEVDNLFRKKSYCYCSSRKPMEEYLLDLKKSQFVLSPTGRGLDCFRTWEAILVGSIPIVKTSNLDPLLKGLPVIIVNDWKKINQKFLKEKIEELYTKEYSLEKLYISYWKEYIERILEKEGMAREL